jgi:pimeloyl-ACP methyl ester carboxylesterase
LISVEINFSFVELSTGIRMHVAQSGSGVKPSLLLLHGFPEFWAAWADVMPLLAEHFNLLAPDLRGFNRTDKPAEVRDYRAGMVASDVVALMDALGIPSAYVAGHDWGGAIAWTLALSHPRRVRALGICNAPHPYLFARALSGDAGQQKASAYMLWLRKPGSESALLADDCALLERFFLGASGPLEKVPAWWTPDRRALYREAWMQPGAMLAGTHYYRAAPWVPGQVFAPLDPAAFRLSTPTLVVWGEKDEALLPVLLEGLEQFVDELAIERLPTASHWLLHEEPEVVADALHKHFLKHPIF